MYKLQLRVKKIRGLLVTRATTLLMGFGVFLKETRPTTFKKTDAGSFVGTQDPTGNGEQCKLTMKLFLINWPVDLYKTMFLSDSFDILWNPEW